MRVQVYAVLKDYFEKDFELPGEIKDVASLKSRLGLLNPAAGGVLDICRFAVGDDFIDNDFQLNQHDTVYIIPPGSGG